jgi:hypothetical protein
MPPIDAIRSATEALRGARPPKAQRFPDRTLQKIRKIRAMVKRKDTSPETRSAALSALRAIMLDHKRRGWSRRLKQLAGETHADEDTWKLQKFLSRKHCTAPGVGPSAKEICDGFSAIYSDNTTRSADWDSTPSTETTTDYAVNPFDSDFTSDEVVYALRHLPSGKGAGVDQVPLEVYKSLAEDSEIVAVLRDEANGYLRGVPLPPITHRFITIPKKGAPSSVTDVRPIMIAPSHHKLLEKLLAVRLEGIQASRGGDQMFDLQGGFRKGKGLLRQLAFVQVAIDEAQVKGERLRVVGLDLVKAFDSIPKEFVAHCVRVHLGPDIRRVGDLICRVALCDATAQLDGESFKIETGVPQGGILSPWMFICCMNQLGTLLKGTGYTTSNGICLGSLFYADDIVLIDDDTDESERRCRIVEEWLGTWGGRIHPSKTQWIDYNSYLSPVPFSPELPPSLSTSLHVDYLGMRITSLGIVGPHLPSCITDGARDLNSIYSQRGLAPGVCLQMLRATAWARLSHGSPVSLPDPSPFLIHWIRAATNIFCSFRATHRVEVARELGSLCNPYWWTIRDTIKFYSGALQGIHHDQFLQNVLRALPPDHLFVARVESRLACVYITWEDLSSESPGELLNRAEANIHAWFCDEIERESERLGLDISHWEPVPKKPLPYTFLRNARYGFIFRRSHIGPSDQVPEPCSFCKTAGGNNGNHLRDCPVVRTTVPLPLSLSNLPETDIASALLLGPGVPRDRLIDALSWYKELWKHIQVSRRATRHPVVKRRYPHSASFLRVPVTRVRRPRQPRIRHSTSNKRKASQISQGSRLKRPPNKRHRACAPSTVPDSHAEPPCGRSTSRKRPRPPRALELSKRVCRRQDAASTDPLLPRPVGQRIPSRVAVEHSLAQSSLEMALDAPVSVPDVCSLPADLSVSSLIVDVNVCSLPTPPNVCSLTSPRYGSCPAVSDISDMDLTIVSVHDSPCVSANVRSFPTVVIPLTADLSAYSSPVPSNVCSPSAPSKDNFATSEISDSNSDTVYVHDSPCTPRNVCPPPTAPNVSCLTVDLNICSPTPIRNDYCSGSPGENHALPDLFDTEIATVPLPVMSCAPRNSGSPPSCPNVNPSAAVSDEPIPIGTAKGLGGIPDPVPPNSTASPSNRSSSPVRNMWSPPKPAAHVTQVPCRTGAAGDKEPWTEAEDLRLAEAVQKFGRSSALRLSREIQSRSMLQVKSRLKTVSFSKVLEKLMTKTGSNSEPLPRTNTGRWSEQELALLVEACSLFGPSAPRKTLSDHVTTRSALQIFDKLKEPGFQRRLAATIPPTPAEAPTDSLTDGRWSDEEFMRLEQALNKLGGSADHAALSREIRTRTAMQVASQLQNLGRTGRLNPLGGGKFTILRPTGR